MLIVQKDLVVSQGKQVVEKLIPSSPGHAAQTSSAIAKPLLEDLSIAHRRRVLATLSIVEALMPWASDGCRLGWAQVGGRVRCLDCHFGFPCLR